MHADAGSCLQQLHMQNCCSAIVTASCKTKAQLDAGEACKQLQPSLMLVQPCLPPGCSAAAAAGDTTLVLLQIINSKHASPLHPALLHCIK
jgi:hypothetical protein